MAAVGQAVRAIGLGGLDKVVLARDVVGTAEEDLDPRWLVRRLSEEYAQCWTYAVDGLVGATPEMLVKREAGLATSRVLAGTIRRSDDAEHDLSLGAALAQSSKDLEEHEYAVASVARALRPYCSGMNVPDAPYVLELPNVLHLATDVTAVADPQRELADPGRRPASQCRRLRHPYRSRSGPDRRAGAPGPGTLRRAGRLDRRRRRRGMGDRAPLRPDQ